MQTAQREPIKNLFTFWLHRKTILKKALQQLINFCMLFLKPSYGITHCASLEKMAFGFASPRAPHIFLFFEVFSLKNQKRKTSPKNSKITIHRHT